MKHILPLVASPGTLSAALLTCVLSEVLLGIPLLDALCLDVTGFIKMSCLRFAQPLSCQGWLSESVSWHRGATVVLNSWWRS
jgi:hypothetical protein